MESLVEDSVASLAGRLVATLAEPLIAYPVGLLAVNPVGLPAVNLVGLPVVKPLAMLVGIGGQWLRGRHSIHFFRPLRSPSRGGSRCDLRVM